MGSSLRERGRAPCLLGEQRHTIQRFFLHGACVGRSFGVARGAADKHALFHEMTKRPDGLRRIQLAANYSVPIRNSYPLPACQHSRDEFRFEPFNICDREARAQASMSRRRPGSPFGVRRVRPRYSICLEPLIVRLGRVVTTARTPTPASSKGRSGGGSLGGDRHEKGSEKAFEFVHGVKLSTTPESGVGVTRNRKTTAGSPARCEL